MVEKMIIRGERVNYTEKEWYSLTKLEKKQVIRNIKLKNRGSHG